MIDSVPFVGKERVLPGSKNFSVSIPVSSDSSTYTPSGKFCSLFNLPAGNSRVNSSAPGLY